jgi:hypothetical protein
VEEALALRLFEHCAAILAERRVLLDAGLQRLPPGCAPTLIMSSGYARTLDVFTGWSFAGNPEHSKTIDLRYWTTPNGHKITIALEETAVPYRIVPVNVSAGEQFAPSFLRISPNNRIPAIVDHAPKDDDGPLAVFESGAIRGTPTSAALSLPLPRTVSPSEAWRFS